MAKERVDWLIAGQVDIKNKITVAGTDLTAAIAELGTLDGLTASVAELNIMDGVTASAAELNLTDGLLATTAELNRAADVSTRVVAVTTTPLAITELAHDGKVIVIDLATGVAVTLPAATGSGTWLRFRIKTAMSGGSTTIKVTGNDTMVGQAFGLDDDGVPANAWTCGTTDDTITLDGTTTGGKAGDSIDLIDIAADLWQVNALIKQSGTEATPFSATVP